MHSVARPHERVRLTASHAHAQDHYNLVHMKDSGRGAAAEIHYMDDGAEFAKMVRLRQRRVGRCLQKASRVPLACRQPDVQRADREPGRRYKGMGGRQADDLRRVRLCSVLSAVSESCCCALQATAAS